MVLLYNSFDILETLMPVFWKQHVNELVVGLARCEEEAEGVYSAKLSSTFIAVRIAFDVRPPLKP